MDQLMEQSNRLLFAATSQQSSHHQEEQQHQQAEQDQLHQQMLLEQQKQLELKQFEEELGEWTFGFENPSLPTRTSFAPVPAVVAEAAPVASVAAEPVVSKWMHELTATQQRLVQNEVIRRLRAFDIKVPVVATGRMSNAGAPASPFRRRKAPSTETSSVTALPFSTPLNLQLEASSVGTDYGRIPSVLFQLISHLRASENLKVDGVLRHSGSKRRVDEEIARICNGNLNVSHLQPHDATVILKNWLKSLPDPLLTNRLTPAFLQALQLFGSADQYAQLVETYQLISLLMPDAHIAATKYLLDYATNVAEHASFNRMTAQNVATVLSPNVFTSTDDPQELMIRTFNQSTVFVELMTIRTQLGMLPDSIHALVQASADAGQAKSVKRSASITSRGKNGDRAADSESITTLEGGEDEDGAKRSKRRRTSSMGGVGQLIVGGIKNLARRESGRIKIPEAVITVNPVEASTSFAAPAFVSNPTAPRISHSSLLKRQQDARAASRAVAGHSAGRTKLKAEPLNLAFSIAPSFTSPMKAVSARIPSNSIIIPPISKEDLAAVASANCPSDKPKAMSKLRKRLSLDRFKAKEISASNQENDITMNEPKTPPMKRPTGIQIVGSPSEFNIIPQEEMLNTQV